MYYGLVIIYVILYSCKGAVIKFDRYRGGSKSLKTPKIFIPHKKYAKIFHNPTIICKKFSYPHLFNFISLQ